MYGLKNGCKTVSGKTIWDPHFSLENTLFTKSIVNE